MSDPYDIPTYLLDKANIQDTMVRMMHAIDNQDSATTINAVYAPEFHIDYDPLLGGAPETVSNEVWAQRLEHMHDEFDTTQHVMQNIIISLPQPTTKPPPQRPDTCTAVAYSHGHFYNRDADKCPRIMVMRTGGVQKLELVRIKGLEEKGENPWRVSKQQVRLLWQDKAEE